MGVRIGDDWLDWVRFCVVRRGLVRLGKDG